METKVAINGFGRIGRLLYRAALETETDIETVHGPDLWPEKTIGFRLNPKDPLADADPFFEAYAEKIKLEELFISYAGPYAAVEGAYEKLEEIGGVITAIGANSKKVMSKLVGSTWRVNSFLFWMLLLSSLGKVESEKDSVKIETDKKCDSENAFQNLRCPPPAENCCQSFASLIETPFFLSAEGGGCADMPNSTHGQSFGELKCKESKRSLRKACRLGKKRSPSLKRKLQNCMNKLLKLSRKTLKWQKKPSQYYSGFTNLPLSIDIWKHLVFSASSLPACYCMPASAEKKEHSLTFFVGVLPD